ncbi:MAG: hypothetical protein ABIO67_05000 [Mycobacteriales bacterium]
MAARDGLIVGLVCGLGIALLVGWLGTGHASAPDDGLLQIDMLTLHERVDGVETVDGLPTMVVIAGRCEVHRQPGLKARYGTVLHRADEPGYADLARALALPQAIDRCEPGYVLLDRDGWIRYRSYDPGWWKHATEQEILLDATATPGSGGRR